MKYIISNFFFGLGTIHSHPDAGEGVGAKFGDKIL